MEGEKADKCKICGREVQYYQVDKGLSRKGTPKTSHIAVHVGDPLPANVIVEVPKLSFSSTFRHNMRKVLHTDKASSVEILVDESGQQIRTPEPEPDKALVLVQDLPAAQVMDIEAPEMPKKEVVIMKPPTVAELREIRTIPEESVGKPILDISEMKRNRFAITGAIASTLRASGLDEPAVNSVRNRLISAGKDFPHLINAGQIHVQFVEGGEPLGYI